MGCMCSRWRTSSPRESVSSNKESGPEFSWDKRERVDPKLFTIENVLSGEAGRMPGSVDGQQFIIQNCRDAKIYVFDHINTVTIDDCNHCKIFLGPVQKSIFIRDCRECVCVFSCGQFRMRDCHSIDVFLCCSTQPVIESSSAIRFGCYQFHYPDLENQFNSARLSEFSGNWNSIHDFTPVDDEQNWSLLPEDTDICDYLPLPTTDALSQVEVSLSSDQSIVPLTVGLQRKRHEESSLVVFFSDGQQTGRAKSFIVALKEHAPECQLINCREVLLSDADAEKIFSTNSYSDVIKRGPVLGLHYAAPDCIRSCLKIGQNIALDTGSTGLMYVSSTIRSANRQIEIFFNLSEIQMAG